MSLFNEVEVESNQSAPERNLQGGSNYRRKKFKGQRAELLKDLSHDTTLCAFAEDERFWEKCETKLVSIGKEFIRTEFKFIPAKIRVIDYYRESYECTKCLKASLPYIEKSLTNLSPEERNSNRPKMENPVLEAFWSWGDSVRF